MRTFIYIDGFNLYNRRLKYRPELKFLNLKSLSDIILQQPMKVERVNYYTARVSGKIDREAPARQQLYLDALATVPEITVHFGKFLYSTKWAKLVEPPEAKPPEYRWPAELPALVLVEKAEEKGSDVNLGSHLVRDALTDKFDVGIVVTNDTDLVEPIRIAVEEAGKRIGLLSPIISGKKNGKWVGPHPSLTKAASFTLYIHNKHLAQAQFPDSIAGTQIKRHASWTKA